MIKVIFFAALREQLGSAGTEISADLATTVAEVKVALGEKNNDWQDYLTNNSLLCAVNHQMVNNDFLVKAGDEVAFFPPVTGG
ncbi:molybdopterin synthase sulfur carrier subunit [Colwellia sp. PAMC 20917]|jgi:molybdopterin synthase sulfur carrier subunit|uniref:molybdopterin converting factor subunit 1 n=1 Tax=Colwellia sp. PAMC 20917 TaxID=1816218 RepID=UPI0008782894|nr:molybdopterin converting factor subunit 1 [Colwellia sp. PAMC 20917]AOW76736.1 molybdopterin synthase sulfur carrier subunit [Colwellia sp. PAMC 20917]|tara:strand:- start:2928 stop:3176 length:249 start_codon:yes stop_codon:yes gene_type:complete